MSLIVKADRGTNISCKGWRQEAILRMLQNNLENAEKPEELIIYGGTGKAARNWKCFDRIVETLKNLENDETLIMQSGKPVAVFKTHENAPKVLMANGNIVPKWANWDVFHELEAKELTMYSQMTAGGWAYIGSQGIVQGTYETFAACGREHFKGDLKGRFILTAGLGGMGGAQPLAATMNGAVCLAVEIDPKRIKKRLGTGYCDMMLEDLDEALKIAIDAKKEKMALSIGLVGNAAETHPEILKKGIIPDIVTDQTSAHDPLNGYVPAKLSLDEAIKLRKGAPKKYVERAVESMGVHVKAMLGFKKKGAIVFDYGNNIRTHAFSAGVKNAFDIKGFVPLYIRPLFCEGKGPFRWVALSGNPNDIKKTDELVMKLFSDNKSLANWIKLAEEKIQFQGLPARVCWLGYGERAKFGLAINEMVKKGELEAPIVITRDNLDTGSVASPNRETEGMKDGSDVIADWPILNALLNTVAGADLIAVQHGGGVGIGYSIHTQMTVVADGTDNAKTRLSRVLNTDPGIGLVRHADAGYDTAIESVKNSGIKMPMLK